MTARSDLDLMTLYRAADAAAVSAGKGWAAETFYARFTQRLIAALSAPTAEGGLYEVDLQLRPSGTAGPVAVSLAALEGYYAGEARDLGAPGPDPRPGGLGDSAPASPSVSPTAIEAALRRPRDPAVLAREVRDMRALMEQERPPSGFWDLKLAEGGLVDIEFAAQYLQLVHAAAGGPLRRNTGRALEALLDAGFLAAGSADALLSAWRLSRSLAQVLRLALEGDGDPEAEPEGLKALMAQAAGVDRFGAVRPLLADLRGKARAAFEAVVALGGAAGLDHARTGDRPVDRQGEADRGAHARLALQAEGAAVHLDQRLGQGQAQARALLGLGVLALDLLEGLGQAGQVFRRRCRCRCRCTLIRTRSPSASRGARRDA